MSRQSSIYRHLAVLALLAALLSARGPAWQLLAGERNFAERDNAGTSSVRDRAA